MEFIMGLITGYLLNWFALSGLILLAIFFEAIDCPKTAVFLVLLTGFVAYLFFQIPLAHVAYGLAAYLVIGVLWSIWRYKRYVQWAVAEDPHRSEYKHLAPAHNTGRIIHWWLVWPVSMISNVIGDLMVLAKRVVTDWLRSIYEGIYRDATTKKQ